MILTDYYKATKFHSGKYRYEIVSGTFTYEIFQQTLINKKNPNKGGLSFNFGDVPASFNAFGPRRADKCITRGGNISSVYTPNITLPYSWGDIHNPKTKIRTQDALIVIISPDGNTIELIISRNQRNNARQVYQQLCDGLLDEELELLRNKAKPVKRD